MSALPKKPAMFSSADAVEAAFYDALQRGDHKGLMSLWTDDDDVVCVHPGQPRTVGMDAVSASWKSIFEEQGRVTVKPTGQKIFESATLSVHCVIEEVINEDMQQVVHCSAVNVYTKEGAGWRILSHHACTTGIGELTASSIGVSLH